MKKTEGFHEEQAEELKRTRNCQSRDELMDFAGNEGVELPDEFLDMIAGGKRIDFRPVELDYFDPNNPEKKSQSNFC
jgi:hypothetical protein